MSIEVKNILKVSPVIPVIVIDDLDDAVPLAKSLVEGGLNVLEVTLRTKHAIQAIQLIKEALPQAYIGSGTVIDAYTLESSMSAGVDFIVSPGTNANLIDAAKANNAPLLAGVSTASEVMNLQSHGYECMKFFPASAAGGPSMLSALSGPLPQAIFCPTGGITLATAPDYLTLNNVACVGGSWMLDKSLISAKRWSDISLLAQQASDLKSR